MVMWTDYFLYSSEKEDKCEKMISTKGKELNLDDGQNTQWASNVSDM